MYARLLFMYRLGLPPITSGLALAQAVKTICRTIMDKSRRRERNLNPVISQSHGEGGIGETPVNMGGICPRSAGSGYVS